MPELPEVETVCRGLTASVAGDTIEKVALARADLRIPFPKGFAAALAGKKIKSITRRAKYIIVNLSGGLSWIIHLGMSGRMTVANPTTYKAAAHDHVKIDLKSGKIIVFNDARRFGLMELAKDSEISSHKFFSHLGPEPFSDDFNTGYLTEQLAKRKTPIKVAIMDQELVVGVGNIYASEALFRIKVSPKLPANKLSKKKAAELIEAIRAVLAEAIESGGSTLRDYVRSTGDKGYFQHNFKVYGKDGKPCTVCKTPIEKIRQAGRSTFYCPKCQKK